MDPKNIDRATDIINEVYKIKRDMQTVKDMANQIYVSEAEKHEMKIGRLTPAIAKSDNGEQNIAEGMFFWGLPMFGQKPMEQDQTIHSSISNSTSIEILLLIRADLYAKQQTLLKELETL